MATEAKRECGYRKVGGLYLVCSGDGVACHRLPLPLVICPTCSGGIKQTRGWTWVHAPAIFGGPCGNSEPHCLVCPACDPDRIGRCGLKWVGGRFYPMPDVFQAEAKQQGISLRIATIPHGFEIGKTWVLLAHPKAVRLDGEEFSAGVFRAFMPERLEQLITESQSKDEKAVSAMQRRGITPVIVPDDDPNTEEVPK